MIVLNQKDVYLKGTCEVTVKDPHNGRIVFQNNKIETNRFNTEIEMGPIRAGLGNPIAIQIPGNAGVNVELTTADFSMQGRAMQIGSKPKYNGISAVCVAESADLAEQLAKFTIDTETMELTVEYPDAYKSGMFFMENGVLYVSRDEKTDFANYYLDTDSMEMYAEASTAELILHNANPVAYYGDKKPYCYINYANSIDLGKAYSVGRNGHVIGFAAIPGAIYNVMYYERTASTRELTVSAIFAPGIYTVMARMAVFSADGWGNAARGAQIGWANYYIPRMQFAGNGGVNGSQTEHGNTTLNGIALSFSDAAKMGENIDCTFPTLAYMTYEPMESNGNRAIAALAVVGGGVYVSAGEQSMIPVKYIMADGRAVQPKYSDLTFSIMDGTLCTVMNGVITGIKNGVTTMEIGLKNGGVGTTTVDVYVN